jgi:hypothetical protein
MFKEELEDTKGVIAEGHNTMAKRKTVIYKTYT